MCNDPEVSKTMSITERLIRDGDRFMEAREAYFKYKQISDGEWQESKEEFKDAVHKAGKEFRENCQ